MTPRYVPPPCRPRSHRRRAPSSSPVRRRPASRRSPAGGDDDQVLAYDLAHAAAAVETAGRCSTTAPRATSRPGSPARSSPTPCRPGQPGLRAGGRLGRRAGALDGARDFVATYRDPAVLASLAGRGGPRHLDDDFELVQDTFRRFAEDKLKPVAEHVHRHNDDIPEDVIGGLAEMGGFGLSVPEEYGGYGSGGESEYIGMVVATEELSRGSLGAGGR